MKEFLTALPTQLTRQLAGHRDGLPVNVFAQNETRWGVQPIIRHRMTACGVQPVATVWPRVENFDLFRAVEPMTGDSFFLERPLLNSAMFPRWLDDFAQTFATAFTILVLDNGAFHPAKRLRWPANVAAVPLPPYSPELNPSERLWRDLKAQLADTVSKNLEAFSDAVCRLLHNYSHAVLTSLTGFVHFVQAVQTALHTANV